MRQAGSIALIQAPKGELRLALILLLKSRKCDNGHCQKGFTSTLVFLSKLHFCFSFSGIIMEINTVCSILRKILSPICFSTPLKHFMVDVENDPQCIRECVVRYFVLFAVYNGPGQHLTRMEAHQGRPIRT